MKLLNYVVTFILGAIAMYEVCFYVLWLPIADIWRPIISFAVLGLWYKVHINRGK